MADNTIDTLQLEVKSNSTGAVKALENLSKTLYKVNSAFKSVNNGGMRNYAREIGRVSASIKYLSGLNIDTKSISGIGKEFKILGEKITGIDANKIGITANGIEKVAKSLSILGGLNLKDSKINNTLGALKRLAEVDMSRFDAAGISNVVNSISLISNIPDVSSGINRFISSLQKLVNAGDKTYQVSLHLPALGTALRKVINDISRTKNISDSVNLFAQSIGRLANAGDKTGQTANRLKDLASETLRFFNTMKNAPKISDSTIRMTQALAQLASSGGKVGKATNSITNSFSKLSSIGGKTSSVIKRVANSVAASFKKIGTSSNGLKTASFNLSGLLKTAVGFGAIHGLFIFGKNAVKLGSDIEEVQNVVDVAFGNMSKMVDEFASTSMEKFGLSELSAKQYSGTMMAMLKSSGITQKTAAEMSTTLAGLSGDIASFYNIDTDEAFRKIRSGIAGEIEPLRQLGISMTVANLEAYALSQGITKSYQSMTQAEQAMLRYNYLMWASADAQGDFARTSGSWANQVRMLKLNIQQLSATIGQGIIAAVLPAIQALNKLISVLIKAANAFKVFMYTLMGKKIGNSTGGIVEDISGIGDAGDNIAGGLDDASNSAEKLKKKLSVLPFDQLNQLTENMSNNKPGGSGNGSLDIGGGSGGLDTGLDEILSDDKEGEINHWAKRIREAFLSEDWAGLGFEIADGINKGLQKVYDVLNWKNVGPKITAFTNAFTKTFNSLVDNFDWDLLGTTIGTGINTLVNTLNQLIEGIDWVNLGSKISSGIRGAIEEINWTNLGNLLGKWFMTLWKMLYGAALNFPYAQLGTAIGKGIKGSLEKIDFQTITDTLANLFNGIFESLKNFNAEKPFEGLPEKISSAINNSIKKINADDAAKSLSDFVISLLDTLIKAFEGTDWSVVGTKIGEFLSNIKWKEILSKIGELIWEAIKAAIEAWSGSFDAAPVATGIVSALGAAGIGAKVVGFFSKIFTGTTLTQTVVSSITGSNGIIGKIAGAFSGGSNSLVANAIGVFGLNIIGKLKNIPAGVTKTVVPALGTAVGGIGKVFSGASGLIGGAVSAIGSTLSAMGPTGWIVAAVGAGAIALGTYIYKNWDDIKAAAGDLVDWVGNKFEDLKEWSSKTWDKISKGLSNTWENLKKNSSKLFDNITKGISDGWNTLKDNTQKTWDNIKNKLSGTWENLKTNASTTWSNLKTTISSSWDNIKTNTDQTWNNLKGNLSTTWENIKTTSSSTWEKIKTTATSSWGTISKNVTVSAKELKNGISTAIKGIPSTVSGVWKSVSKSTSSAWKNIHGTATRFAKNIASGISGAFSGLTRSIGNIFSSISNAASRLWGNIKSTFSSGINVRYSSSIQRYANGGFIGSYASGGFPSTEIWGMNESGNPEMIGRLGNGSNRTAVANNAIISDAIEGAVERAMSRAMMNNHQNPVNVTCYAELKTENDEVLARAVTRGQRKLDYRMNPTPQFGY